MIDDKEQLRRNCQSLERDIEDMYREIEKAIDILRNDSKKNRVQNAISVLEELV